ncbi:hypothetical protein K7432_011433 [Basidiobolus ranarum]|uniref:Uncharacterized protein n=1 Tax=Basidiobolus ranarum TaxID=34480 RepID=A0ABR2VUV1_9FUNG
MGGGTHHSSKAVFCNMYLLLAISAEKSYIEAKTEALVFSNGFRIIGVGKLRSVSTRTYCLNPGAFG